MKKELCNDPTEQDLIQDYLEDLLCLANRQQPPKATQEIEPKHAQNLEHNTQNADKQIPQTQIEELNSMDNKLCKVQGIEEIPWQQSQTKQVLLPLKVPETYRSATRMLGLFKQTTSSVTKPKHQHKKGIKAPTKGTSNAWTQPEN